MQELDMDIGTAIAIIVGNGLACGAIALFKGRNPILWILAGLLFSVVATILVSILPRTKAKVTESKLINDAKLQAKVDKHRYKEKSKKKRRR